MLRSIINYRSLKNVASVARFCTAAAAVDARPPPPTNTASYEDISRAYYKIKSGIIRTHCDQSISLSNLCGVDVFVKKDHLQFTGSFKERGARYALLQLTAAQRQEGVIAASAGNHALALAWHGKGLGIPVTVVMPTTAPFTKVERCRQFGANVILMGDHIGEAKEYAKTEFSHMRYINGYDDKEIVAGAGTVAMEILEQVPDVDVIVVPIGGAGLIAGVSLATKTLRPDVEVIGVEADNVPSFTKALEVGYPVNGFIRGTLADGLAVPVVGSNAFEVARKHVDKTVLVNEASVSIAVLRLIEAEKMVVEGGGAAALGSLLPGGPLYGKYPGKKVVCILTGGNIDTTILGRVIDRGLAADHRLVRFTATVSDRPGGIANLSAALFEVGVSIKDMYHERAWLHSRVDQVAVKCIVETTGIQQTTRMFELLKERDYPIMRDNESSFLPIVDTYSRA